MTPDDGDGAAGGVRPDDLKALSRQLMVDFMPMASFSEDPFVLVEGDGIRVRDANGRWYIDGMSGVFVSSLGHGTTRLVGAATEQASRLAFAAFAGDDQVVCKDIGKHFLGADGVLSKDVMPDFLHLTPAAYRTWAEAIVADVDALLK